MTGGYLGWQFWYGPAWLLRLAYNLQRANFRLFSVSVMAKTLFAHWHRDALEYKGGSITDQLTTFALNQISRAIGFCIRISTLLAWVISTILLAGISMMVVLLFIFWPLISLLMMFIGLVALGLL